MTTKYAQGTSVPMSRSIAELEAMVMKHGAEHFGYMRSPDGGGQIAFVLKGQSYRWMVTAADPDEHRSTPTGRSRTRGTAAGFAYDETNRRWRAIVLLVKAVLVAAEDGVADAATVLLPWAVLPGGDTVGERVATEGLVHALAAGESA